MEAEHQVVALIGLTIYIICLIKVNPIPEVIYIKMEDLNNKGGMVRMGRQSETEIFFILAKILNFHMITLGIGIMIHQEVMNIYHQTGVGIKVLKE